MIPCIDQRADVADRPRVSRSCHAPSRIAHQFHTQLGAHVRKARTSASRHGYPHLGGGRDGTCVDVFGERDCFFGRCLGFVWKSNLILRFSIGAAAVPQPNDTLWLSSLPCRCSGAVLRFSPRPSPCLSTAALHSNDQLPSSCHMNEMKYMSI